MSPLTPGRGGIDRRRFIQAGAAGAVVGTTVWAAPSIFALDGAAACGTCAQSAFNWGTYSDGQAGLVTDIDGVRISIVANDAGGQGVSPSFVVQTGTGANRFGLQTRWWQMRQNAVYTASTTAQQTATFSFTRVSNGQPIALTGLCFSLLDIDLRTNRNNGWRDEVWVTNATGGAIPFGYSLSSPTNGPTGAGTDGNRWIGKTNVDNESTDGNVLVTFTGGVTAFRVNYRNYGLNNGRPAANYIGSIMRVGIANLSWCRI